MIAIGNIKKEADCQNPIWNRDEVEINRVKLWRNIIYMGCGWRQYERKWWKRKHWERS